MGDPEDLRQKLRAATAAEKASITKRAQRYKSLTDKISAYQNGTGPAPTVAEFSEWKADVEVDLALRRLLAGLSDD